MELDIGSNIIRNTNGVLNVTGKQQISLEFERDRLLLTMDIYDFTAAHIAKLRRNAWVFNNKDRFVITTAPTSLKLQDKETDETVVEVNVVTKDKIRIHHGRFHTHKGDLLEITPKYWCIYGRIVTMSGNVFDSLGGAVKIG